MEFDTQVKLAVYRHFAETGRAPALADVAEHVGAENGQVSNAYRRLAAQRLLHLTPDGASIHMAPPFSGVPTQHVVESQGVQYSANCAWDALGIVAALRRPGTVRSRCAQSGDALELEVGPDGPMASSWLFHCLVPAARWWDDIGFT